jgi:hypothetical protein
MNAGFGCVFAGYNIVALNGLFDTINDVLDVKGDPSTWV